jgi:phosphomethylpyrimidine synthase
MRITEDLRAFAAEEGLSVEKAREEGLEAKREEFAAAGGELYVSAD